MKSTPDPLQSIEIPDPDFTQSDADAKPPLALQEEKPFFYTVADLHKTPDPEWLIENMLAEDGIGAFIGKSKGGKSFLAIDLAFCVARGESFFGYETKQSDVVYLCFEGQGRFKYRLFAWEIANNEKAPDNFFIKYDCDFLGMKPEDIAKFPPKCLTIVDTLSAAAPRIDENGFGMKEIIDKAKGISKITGGAVLIIHHMGKDEKQGSRGHSSFPAGIDTEFFIKRNGDSRSWEVNKNRDGEEGITGSFTLKKIQIGVDKKGRPITSCVVVESCETPAKDPTLTPKEKASLDALQKMCSQSGTNEILLSTWRNIGAHYTGDNNRSEKTTFERVCNNLTTKGFIAINADMVRLLR